MDYSELEISAENKEFEEKIMLEIDDCIDTMKSFVFDAGAGAGKTYSLVETLKYILTRYGKELNQHKQKVICITYTNVAAEEIRIRLGNTKLVEVSTIHSWLWGIVEPHQNQLVEKHIEKLEIEIKEADDELNRSNWAKKYYILQEQSKTELLAFLNENQEKYYQNKSLPAAKFREFFSDLPSESKKLMGNVGDFRKVADRLIRIERYRKTLVHIKNNELGYRKVKYDSRFNKDILTKMMISHDTLLSYAAAIISKNDLLKQIIFDGYPYILVDEYQDTSENVITLLAEVGRYAQEKNHRCVIGYFGDKKQNIYDDGIGSEFDNLHPNTTRIMKIFNRRSCNEIINIANQIRNDDLEQQSIYTNFSGGNVNFYNGEISKERFIEEHIKQWDISKDNPLHCLELRNEDIANSTGFGEIYTFFQKSPFYKNGKNYELLRDHILNSDITKLGRVQRVLFEIILLKQKMANGHTEMLDLISSKLINKEINITSLRIFIQKLSIHSATNFKDYAMGLFENFKTGDSLYDNVLQDTLGEDLTSYNDLKKYILEEIFLIEGNKIDESQLADYTNEIEIFMNLDINIFELWCDFVLDKVDREVLYHTYHGTKGKEYDNVIITMSSKFGTKNEFFAQLLNAISEKSGLDSEEILQARNLLYVAVTRAIKNLSILYLDDINNKTVIRNIFGNIHNDLK